jgi:glutathione S-transferase
MQKAHSMILYGSSLSPYVRKVLAYCGERGIEVESRIVGPGDLDPEFRKASPFGRIPALADGDYRLADSSAIIHYLEAKHPDRPLIPEEPKARGKTIWFEEFADTVLISCGARIFFNLIVAPRFLGLPGDEEAARRAEINDLPPILDYLEKAVPGDGGYLVGDALTLADIAVASPFANFRHTNTRVDPDKYPRTVAYVDRILARPSLAPWVDRETAFLAKEPA